MSAPTPSVVTPPQEVTLHSTSRRLQRVSAAQRRHAQANAEQWQRVAILATGLAEGDDPVGMLRVLMIFIFGRQLDELEQIEPLPTDPDVARQSLVMWRDCIATWSTHWAALARRPL